MKKYTELNIKIKFIKSTPPEIIEILDTIINNEQFVSDGKRFFKAGILKLKPEFKVDFFTYRNWIDVLVGKNDLTKDQYKSEFYKRRGYWTLNLHTKYESQDNGGMTAYFYLWIKKYIKQNKTSPGYAINNGKRIDIKPIY